MDSNLRSEFEAAVERSKTLTERPDNETLLRVYSLFKQANDGDCQGDPPSNPFDFVNKAKYEAWTELRGMSAENAMQAYIDLISQLR